VYIVQTSQINNFLEYQTFHIVHW